VKRIIVLAVSVILALIVAAPTMVFAADNSPVVPPHKGHYAKLSKEWWKWAYSVPASENPLADATETDGSKCAAGQPAAGKRGGVWFLGGLFTAPGEPFPEGGHVERTCDVPSGRSIFFPIFNTECSTVESNPPLVNPDGTPIPSAKADVDTLRKCAKYAIDWGLGLLPAGEPPGTGEHKLASLNASIDGVPIGNLNPKKTPFRVASGPFKFTLVKNSIDTFCLSGDPNATQYVQCPAGESRAAADGVYLRLDPLPAGPHTIRFGGTFFDGGFPLDVTYHINQG
jgi:hypothetical protein